MKALREAVEVGRRAQELSEAERLWLDAARKGDAGAQARLGRAYAFGQNGAREDPKEGAEWLKKAADQGDEPRGDDEDGVACAELHGVGVVAVDG